MLRRFISVKILFVAVLHLYAALDIYAQAVLISEIVADNDDSLTDEDNESPDWIELYNSSNSPVSLTGWHLTDDQDDLTKWTFPNTTIAAKSFLIVFASDKNRATPGSELHTNFKLSAGGEYIALIRPDSNTIEDDHTFSAQQEDFSYGYTFSGGTTSVLLDSNSSCTARVPTNSSDSIGWQENQFTPVNWQNGATGVGYDSNSNNYTSLIGLNVISMRNHTGSVYIRVPFTTSNVSAMTELVLKMKYDDGFIAYLNGEKVTQSLNAPETPAWNSLSTGFNSDSNAVVFESFDVSEHLDKLVDGNNVLAIHGLNGSIGSSDLIIMPRIEATVSSEIDPSETATLASPTPGRANTTFGFEGFIEPMQVSPERGFYDTTIPVTLTNPTPGSSIHYTTDGSEPTQNSPLYTTPINIGSTTNLRSKAFRNNWSPSRARTDSYIFVNDVVLQPESTTVINSQEMKYGMDAGVRNKTYLDASNQLISVQDALKAIPTMSITTNEDNLFDSATGIYVNAEQRWERPASLELIYPDGQEGFQINFGLRIRGGYSRQGSYEKHAFRCLFKKEYGAGKLHYPLFKDEGVDEFDNIDLRTAINHNWANANSVNNTFVRDITSRDTQGDTGNIYTRSRYYHLYLNGQYWGLYMTEERPEASFAASYMGGSSEDYDVIKTQNLFDIDPYTIEATDGTLDAYSRLYSAAISGFSSNSAYFSIQGMDTSGEIDPTKERLLDVENLIDHMLIIYYYAAIDNGITQFFGDRSLNNLYAVYNRAKPDGFKWILHDCEHSLDVVASNFSSKLDRTGPFTNSNFNQFKYFNPQTLHEKLSLNPEYRIKFADRVHKHLQNNGAMTSAASQERIDKRAAEIDKAIIANAARWGSTSRDRDTWTSAVANARSFFGNADNRSKQVINYLANDGLIPSVDAPTIHLADGMVASGTSVSLTTATGTIYYTTDGSDPRAIGGGIQASTYTTPITLTKPTHLKARARANGIWSALEEGTFWTPEMPLAVTELMYHAPEGNAHDFIEIQNISNETITLKGYKLDKGIDFKLKNSSVALLSPGEIIVVVDDIDAFTAKYGDSGITIAGEFSGDFSNSGERIDFEFRDNDLISFTYSDARNWPLAADGAGHSLIPLESAMSTQENSSLDYGGNWRASTNLGGSPGSLDPSASSSVLINEVIAHTDTGFMPPFDSNDVIELYNNSNTPILLNDWYLSDSRNNLYKWAIPNGTVIPANGFIAFDENNFHVDRVIGFGLNKAGEAVILSNSSGVVDAIRFKGQENGVAYGRYPNGSQNWMTTNITIGSTNTIPEQTFQISRVMYHPDTLGNDAEYIQIENISSATISFSNASGNYRIDGAVNYDFTPSTTLEAGQYLWIVSFDPKTEIALLEAFTAKYNLSAESETIIGPYSGSLSNRTGRVALERPQDSDDPAKPLDLSWVVVDEVYYFDQSPWTSGADGTGYPLVRTGLSLWGAASLGDSDADHMLDSWEIANFSSLTQAFSDWDFDGFSNVEEFTSDTDPKDPSSFFKFELSVGNTLTWSPKTGRNYTLFWTSDLSTPFVPIASGLSSGSYTDIVNSANQTNFYYLQVELD